MHTSPAPPGPRLFDKEEKAGQHTQDTKGDGDNFEENPQRGVHQGRLVWCRYGQLEEGGRPDDQPGSDRDKRP